MGFWKLHSRFFEFINTFYAYDSTCIQMFPCHQDMSEKCSRLRIYSQIFMVTIKQIPTDNSLTASTNVISMQFPNTIPNTEMTLPQLVGPIDVVSPEHSSGDRSHEFHIASSKNVSIKFYKAEYARPTKAELAHCTTSARSSKYAQSQKLSSLTSHKYWIFPQLETRALSKRCQQSNT